MLFVQAGVRVPWNSLQQGSKAQQGCWCACEFTGAMINAERGAERTRGRRRCEGSQRRILLLKGYCVLGADLGAAAAAMLGHWLVCAAASCGARVLCNKCCCGRRGCCCFCCCCCFCMLSPARSFASPENSCCCCCCCFAARCALRASSGYCGVKFCIDEPHPSRICPVYLLPAMYHRYR